MATSSDQASLPPAGAPGHHGHRPGGKLVEYDEFIDAQLRTTRSHVRSVDLASELMVLAAGTLVFFLVAGVVDHWVIPGGLGFWGRLLLLAGLIAAIGYALAVRVLPLLLRRINPLYAAHTIERSSPTLKNSLVNFLMFRANPAALNDNVYQAIEEQAATRLAGTHVEAAVDRTKLIRIGYVLVAIVVAAALYAIVSPKNLFKTVGRVVMPWAQIDAPTRTVISQLEPGDTQAFRGQQVTISAFVEGLSADARPRVLYSSADGQMVDAAVEMTLAPNEYRHSCVLPASDASLQQSLSYRIEAGDAVTRPYMVTVVAAPTIAVDSVEYKYPSYTGLLPQRVQHQGDIRAIEGTQITIHASANENIHSAYIDFDCDGKLDQPMQTDAATASAKFTIEFKPDRQTPAQNSYQLIFKNDAGQANPQPVRHRIEVTRDLPPEIQLVSPKKDEIDLPLNGAVDLEIVANDPDFALRSVKLSAMRGDERLFEKPLLNEVWRGQLVRKFRFEPTKLGLKQGDQVAYFAVAEDNKEPQPNRSETAKRRIRIVSPVDRKASEDQVAKNDKNRGDDDQASGESKQGDGQQGHDEDPANAARDEQNKPGDPRGAEQPPDARPENSPEPRDDQGDERSDRQDQKDKSQDNQASGQKSSGQKDGGDESQSGGEQQAAPNDGSNDRDAIERILERRDEQNKGQSDAQNSDGQSKGDEQQSGSKGQGDGKGAEQKAGRDSSKAGAKDKSTQDRSSQAKQQGDRKPDENSSPDKRAGDEQSQRDQGSSDDRRPGERHQDQGDQNQRGQDERSQNEQGTQQGKGQPDGQKKSSRDKSAKKDKGQSGQAGNDESTSSEQTAGQSDQKGSGSQRKPADGKQGKDAKQSNDGQASNDAKSEDATGNGEKSAKGKGKPTDKQSTDKQASDEAAKPSDDASGQGKPSKGSKTDGKPDAKRAQPGDKQDQPADAKPADAKPADEPGDPKDAKVNPDNKSGQGKQSKSDPTGKRDAAQQREKKGGDKKEGSGEQEKGNAGAGKPSNDTKGSPEPQEKNQPREKSQRESADEANQKPSDAKSPSTSKRESNSEGKEDGDRSGGGKQGGGQKANQQGTGGAGQNTPSDEGAGQSNDAGKGDSSQRPGNDSQSSEKTGQSGSQQGQGSRTKPTDAEGQPGQGASQGGDAADAKQSDSASGNQSGKSGSSAPDQPTGGQPGSSPTDRKWQRTDDAADAANLHYARKATDLAITHLKDELKKDNPDPELLDRLHWTRDDLEKFVKRWEQMRAQAKTPGETGTAAKRELDDALRSLGLRPKATSLKGDAARGDKSQGYKESRRSSPPPEYAEQYKAYTQGTAKGGK